MFCPLAGSTRVRQKPARLYCDLADLDQFARDIYATLTLWFKLSQPPLATVLHIKFPATSQQYLILFLSYPILISICSRVISRLHHSTTSATLQLHHIVTLLNRATHVSTTLQESRSPPSANCNCILCISSTLVA